MKIKKDKEKDKDFEKIQVIAYKLGFESGVKDFLGNLQNFIYNSMRRGHDSIMYFSLLDNIGELSEKLIEKIDALDKEDGIK